MNAETRPFSLALADPLDTARGPIERREGFLLRVEDAEGSVGVGEAAPLPGWTESREECEAALDDAASALESGERPESVLADLGGGVARGATPAARHALDLALADLRASREGLALYRFLGASDRVESVPVNATVGDAGVEETVEVAERAVESGFDCVKLKVGSRPLAADIERVEAVADALADAELRADANGAWTRPEAQRFLDAVGNRLAYVEQPLPATDLAGLAALSGPVALDETLARVAFEDALDADPDAVVLKPMALGGPRPAVAAAERAREAGVLPVVTTTIDGVVARTAAVHVAAAIPERPACGLATADLLESDLGPDPASVEDGRAVVPQAPGNGTPEVWPDDA
ncbi:o-succinylbenzoate synthase [Halorussus salilacus]|uniref:mandelate racemase/muconate lactonizing enzyme family protein n=1 Tax=Halorussus salilacus TaxID=2953750 RepID=UPI00209CF315|nr:o-succinylbenzoate synthase [Halorussus salilacus]USZ68469.1 o-succinylbenzoate synthase [Halorussus salilacus]